jgi:hypothetical protein
VGAAAVEEVVPAEQFRVVVVAHATRFEVDDPLEVGAVGLDVEGLVDLLLVLGEQHPGARVAQQVAHLRRRVGRVQPDGDPPDRDRADVAEQPLRTVLGVDRDAVTRLDPERDQRVGHELHVGPVVRPGEVLPDAVALLAHAHPARIALGVLADHRGDRPQARARGGCGRFEHGAHELTSSVAVVVVGS